MPGRVGVPGRGSGSTLGTMPQPGDHRAPVDSTTHRWYRQAVVHCVDVDTFAGGAWTGAVNRRSQELTGLNPGLDPEGWSRPGGPGCRAGTIRQAGTMWPLPTAPPSTASWAWRACSSGKWCRGSPCASPTPIAASSSAAPMSSTACFLASSGAV